MFWLKNLRFKFFQFNYVKYENTYKAKVECSYFVKHMKQRRKARMEKSGNHVMFYRDGVGTRS